MRKLANVSDAKTDLFPFVSILIYFQICSYIIANKLIINSNTLMNNPNPNFIHQYSQRTPPIYPVSPTPITQSSPLTCPSAQVNTGFNYPIGWNGPINTFNQPQYQQFQSPYLPNNNQIATSSNPFMQIFQ